MLKNFNAKNVIASVENIFRSVHMFPAENTCFEVTQIYLRIQTGTYFQCKGA